MPELYWEVGKACSSEQNNQKSPEDRHYKAEEGLGLPSSLLAGIFHVRSTEAPSVSICRLSSPSLQLQHRFQGP